MCLMVLTPTQIVESIKRALSRANKSLAESQKEVADALETIDHVVDKFKEGQYKEEKQDYGVVVTTTADIKDNLFKLREDTPGELTRIAAQMQEYKAKEEQRKLHECKCGKKHNYKKTILDGPSMDKASDYV